MPNLLLLSGIIFVIPMKEGSQDVSYEISNKAHDSTNQDLEEFKRYNSDLFFLYALCVKKSEP